jgi:indolepyruvate ferredoxin oxidoreductase, alpha subunit
MEQMLLLGDEAVAVGAIHAGLSAAYGYPGTPSTEIMEYLLNYSAKNNTPHAAWCSNEKTAYEEALGASMVGKRVLVTMKHVGLNVAADPFMNSALVKINGGLVLAVADDPGMHSSQNEQDSRFYADFAKIICFEPRNQQEAYEMTIEAFEVSEKFHIPVLLRLVTRLSHSRAVTKVGTRRKENQLKKSQDKSDWLTLPSIAKAHYAHRLEVYNEFVSSAELTNHNPLTLNESFNEYGVITTGLGCNYYEENLKDLEQKSSHLHIGYYPIPVEKIRTLAEQVNKIIVIEEGYPFVERFLRGILPQKIKIVGKLDNVVPSSGELTPDNVRPALGLKPRKTLDIKATTLPSRPPQLCKGCPHIDTYNAIKDAISDYKNSIVASDIGCYSLGALPPLAVLDSLVCMGASIGMAKGAAEAGMHPVLATIGDSTFLHTGISPLIDAIVADANITLIIMDNSTTAMTGAQDTILPSSKLEGLVKGLGVNPKHLRIFIPLRQHHDKNVAIIKEEIEHKGVSVIIAVRECIKILGKKK